MAYDTKIIKRQTKKKKFKPKLGIIHIAASYVDKGYGVYLTTNKDDKHLNERLFDEPDSSFISNNRKLINFNKL